MYEYNGVEYKSMELAKACAKSNVKALLVNDYAEIERTRIEVERVRNDLELLQNARYAKEESLLKEEFLKITNAEYNIIPTGFYVEGFVNITSDNECNIKYTDLITLNYSYIRSGDNLFVKALPYEVKEHQYFESNYIPINVIGINIDEQKLISYNKNGELIVIDYAYGNWKNDYKRYPYIWKCNKDIKKRIIEKSIIPVEEDKINVAKWLMKLKSKGM